MRQHLHFRHVVREEFDMVADEGLELLLRIAGAGDGLPRPFEDLGETALLDESEQILLPAHVVVHAGERHAARGREIPHRGGVVALVREYPCGAGEQVV